ncbi:unnamed protein product [Sphagnum tenellum]
MSNRAAMDERASPFFNDYARQDLRRRSRRSSGSAWSSLEGTEKLEQAKCSAMAEQVIWTPNGYFCRKLPTRRWSKLTKTRMNSLNVDISPKYLQSSPLSFRNQSPFLTPPRGEPESRLRAPSLLELRKLRKLEAPPSAPFSMVTLLTRGYFEVLFEKEEGAKATRKLGVVEWSGWALPFSRYSALFRSNEHGIETLLTHSIKV